jgi:succinyl-CoA synthetase beta subunit
MHVHEYQGKEMLRQYGVATPRGFVCQSCDEAADAALQLGGECWVVEAQIHAGDMADAAELVAAAARSR